VEMNAIAMTGDSDMIERGDAFASTDGINWSVGSGD
jgi:hypothetical protein